MQIRGGSGLNGALLAWWCHTAHDSWSACQSDMTVVRVHEPGPSAYPVEAGSG